MKLNTPFKCVALKDVVYFQEGPGLRNWQYGTSGIPFLNIRTIREDGTIDKSLCQFVKREEFEGKYEHFLLDDKDFVVSSSGTLGKLAEIRKQDLPLMLNTSVIRFRPIDYSVLDRVYLKWFIKSSLYIRQIQKASTGTAIKNYGPSHLKKMVIPLPPLEEQKRIAKILDKADEIRRKRKESIRLTDELLRSTFLDMFGDPVINPKGWEVVNISKIAEVKTGKTPSRKDPSNYGGNIKWIKTTEVRQNIIEDTEEYLTEKGASQMTIFPKNSIIVAMYGQGITRGRTALLGTSSTTNQACAVILPSNNYSAIYLWTLLIMSYQQLRELGRGGNQPNLNLSMVKNFSIPLPPLDKQKYFEKVQSKIKLQKHHIKQSLQESENLFNSLLQKAFKGEL